MITIVPFEGKCSITLSEHFALLPYPVQGQKNKLPPEPYVEAIGNNPDHAFKEAKAMLGQAVVQAVASGETRIVVYNPAQGSL
jgi:hypothetical protein